MRGARKRAALPGAKRRASPRSGRSPSRPAPMDARYSVRHQARLARAFLYLAGGEGSMRGARKRAALPGAKRRASPRSGRSQSRPANGSRPSGGSAGPKFFVQDDRVWRCFAFI